MSSVGRIDMDEDVFEAIFNSWYDPPSSRARARASKATERSSRSRPDKICSTSSPPAPAAELSRKRASPSAASPASPRLRPASPAPGSKSRRALPQRHHASKRTRSGHSGSVRPSRVGTLARSQATKSGPRQSGSLPGDSGRGRASREGTPRRARCAEAAPQGNGSTEDDELELDALEEGDEIGEEEAAAMLSPAYAGDCTRSQHRAKPWVPAAGNVRVIPSLPGRCACESRLAAHRSNEQRMSTVRPTGCSDWRTRTLRRRPSAASSRWWTPPGASPLCPWPPWSAAPVARVAMHVPPDRKPGRRRRERGPAPAPTASSSCTACSASRPRRPSPSRTRWWRGSDASWTSTAPGCRESCWLSRA